MPEIPAEAVQAAEQALAKVECDHTLGWSCMECRARVAVAAAAPFIAEQARTEERARIAEHAREIAADSPWGHMNLRKFIARHARLVSGDSPVAVLLALADEIESPDREAFPRVAGERSTPVPVQAAPSATESAPHPSPGVPGSLNAPERISALRERYAEAIALWALMYPISAWALAEGDGAKRLAGHWGRVAAKSVMDVRDSEMETLRAALAEIGSILDAHRIDVTGFGRRGEQYIDGAVPATLIREVLAQCADIPEEPSTDEVELIELTVEEYEAALANDLGRLGCTYDELVAMSRTGDYATPDHRLLWLRIKPAPSAPPKETPNAQT